MQPERKKKKWMKALALVLAAALLFQNNIVLKASAIEAEGMPEESAASVQADSSGLTADLAGTGTVSQVPGGETEASEEGTVPDVQPVTDEEAVPAPTAAPAVTAAPEPSGTSEESEGDKTTDESGSPEEVFTSEAAAGSSVSADVDAQETEGQKTILSWEWIGSDCLTDGRLLLPGVSETNPITFETVCGMLPAAVSVQTEGSDTTEEIQLKWSCPEFGASVTGGTYTFTAELPEGYQLAEGTQALWVEVDASCQVSTLAENGLTTLVVGGTSVVASGTVSETTSGDGWSYADGTLTLTDATITGTSSTDYGAAIYAAGDLTIVLEGSSNATGAVHSSDMPFSGLYVSGILTICGEGSLTVSAADATDSRQNYGIYAFTYIQNGGSITSRSGTGTVSYGVYAYSGMTVNKGSLTATGGNAASGATTYDSSGIYVTGPITVGSATVTAAGSSGTNSYGIYSSCGSTNSLTVTGGKVTATGNSSPIYIETYLPPFSSANNHVSVTVSNSGSITAQGRAGIVLKSSQHAGGTGTGSMTVESGSTLLANSVTVNNNPLAPTGEGSWLIYGQSGQTSAVGGSYTLTEDVTIPSGVAVTVPEGSSLTVPDGMTLTVDGTLTNQGTLAIANEDSLKGNGTLSGDGSFVATAVTDVMSIVVPEGVTCADYQEKVALGGPTVLGVPFLANAEGWTVSFEPGVCTLAGRTYTATASNGSETFSQTFTALHSYDEAGKCLCGVSQPQTDAQGRYQLADAFQLRWFAALVNGTLTDGTAQNAAASAVLTADIDLSGENWTPIGSESNPYTGTFDGAGHTIDNLKIDDASAQNQGFVGYLGAGTIQNLILGEGCSVTGGKYSGGICGWNNEGTISGCTNKGSVSGNGDVGGISGHNLGTVNNCTNTGKVTNSGAETVGGICGYSKTSLTGCANSGAIDGGQRHVGGIVGYIDSGVDGTTLQNCTNTGAVTSTNERVGGICGFGDVTILHCWNSGDITGGTNVGGICGENHSKAGNIQSCYSIGTVSGSTSGGICGENNKSIANCYWLDTACSTGIGSGSGEATAKTSVEFASGEVTYLLNGSTSEGDLAWYQNLGDGGDQYPVLDITHGIVYYGANCQGIELYSNSPVSAEHTYDADGFCTLCNRYQPAALNGDVYEISNAGQLFWFAALVNGDTTQAGIDSGNQEANAELTADIDLSGHTWSPIGGNISPYNGTFDGAGHTIDNMNTGNSGNLGLVCYLGYEGVIKDVKLGESCTVAGFYSGGICGNNYGTIQNCTYAGTVTAYYAGGISGTNYGTIENCYAAGTIRSDCYTGGISGSNGGTIENCYAAGTVSGDKSAGGISGYNNGTIENCYAAGTVSGGESAGGISGMNYSAVTNCYWLDDSCSVGIGTGSGTAEKVEGKSADQFASGEVTWLLNGSASEGDLAWYQNLDNDQATDAYPVLDATHGIVYRIDNEPASYSNTDQPAQIISVDITWGELSYTYSDGTWNANTHTYEGAGWTVDTEEGNSITVENTGNTPVTASYTYQATENGITGSFTDGENLVSAPVSLPVQESSTVYLALEGKPAKELDKTPIGSVTVTIGGESE